MNKLIAALVLVPFVAFAKADAEKAEAPALPTFAQLAGKAATSGPVAAPAGGIAPEEDVFAVAMADFVKNGAAKLDAAKAAADAFAAARPTNGYIVADNALVRLYRATGDGKYLKFEQKLVQGAVARFANADEATLAANRDVIARLGGKVGVYIQPDTGLLMAFDSVQAKWVRKPGWFKDGMVVFINPTRQIARVKMLAEKSSKTGATLGEPTTWPEVVVPAYGRMTFRITRAGEIVTK